MPLDRIEDTTIRSYVAAICAWQAWGCVGLVVAGLAMARLGETR